MKIEIPPLTRPVTPVTCDLAEVRIVIVDDGTVVFELGPVRDNFQLTAAQLRELAEAAEALLVRATMFAGQCKFEFHTIKRDCADD